MSRRYRPLGGTTTARHPHHDPANSPTFPSQPSSSIPPAIIYRKTHFSARSRQAATFPPPKHMRPSRSRIPIVRKLPTQARKVNPLLHQLVRSLALSISSLFQRRPSNRDQIMRGPTNGREISSGNSQRLRYGIEQRNTGFGRGSGVGSSSRAAAGQNNRKEAAEGLLAIVAGGQERRGLHGHGRGTLL